MHECISQFNFKQIQFNNKQFNEMKQTFRKIFYLLFFVGSILTLINIYGVFRPWGDDNIYSEKHSLFENDIQKSAKNDINKLLQQENIDNREVYFEKLVAAVNNGIAHYWSEEGRTKYDLTIPIYKNWILWLGQFTNPKRNKYYEFCDYKKALDRRVGLCSQQAIIICGILNEKGIDCKMVGLLGHVVAMAEVSAGKYWILDGDYGVIIPLSISQIEENPSVVESYYLNKLRYNHYSVSQNKNNPISLERMVEIYKKEGNLVSDGMEGYKGKKVVLKEKRSFYLIWIIPVLLMIPLLIIRIK